MTPIQQLFLGTGGAAADKIYVDNVFGNNTYVGDGSTSRNIINNIDLSGEGGMVWYRNRDDGPHEIFDTERGVTKAIEAYDNGNEATVAQGVKAFLSNGFTIGNEDRANKNNDDCCAWAFRKAPGFFDIQTWTGNGSANRKISHNLGSVPGAIWIRRLTGSTGTNVSDWICYHRKSNGGSYPWNFLDYLNRDIWPSNDASGNYLYNQAPASDEFSIGSHQTVNANGSNYVAYLFAHNDQRFGASADKEIIKCDSYTGDGSTSNEINLGWEPQWVLVKNAKVGGSGAGGNWIQWDNMRGAVHGGNDESFSLNAASAEDNFDGVEFTSTGFTLKNAGSFTNANTKPYIFIAIRRPDGYVGKPAEAGTDVFAMDTGNGSSTIPCFDSGFPIDFAFTKTPAASGDWPTYARLIQGKELKLNTSGSGGSDAAAGAFDSNLGFGRNSNGTDEQAWMFKRHAGFDVVAYTGNDTSGRIVNHSLSRVPEMIWIKSRGGSENWTVYHKGLNGGSSPEEWYMYLNSSNAEGNHSFWGSYAPTSTQFKLSGNNQVNANNVDYIATLFASVDGISKVGFWTSNGSNRTETCGFRPRLIIVRKANDSGQWKVFDTLRGLGSTGDDGLLRLESTNAHPASGADFINTSDSGFSTVHVDLKENNKNYIYYAHA